MTETTVESFLQDVAKHRMKVLCDDGLYRHISFHKPGTNDMYFDLLTWPDHLCFTGDMGTYVFTRVVDMFTFFRAHVSGELKPNLSYWAEKCIGIDRDGIEQWSPDTFCQRIRSWVADHYGKAPDADLKAAIEEKVIPHADNGYEAHAAARDFEYEGESIFQDFWEVNCKVYTRRFIWCCYAIQWGIHQYDKATSAVVTA